MELSINGTLVSIADNGDSRPLVLVLNLVLEEVEQEHLMDQVVVEEVLKVL